MANRLTMQAMMIGVVLGMASGTWAEGEVVTPIQQGEVDVGTAITLDQAAAAQAGIQATLGGMQAVASAMKARPSQRPTPRFDFDGHYGIDGRNRTITPPPPPPYDRWKDSDNLLGKKGTLHFVVPE